VSFVHGPQIWHTCGFWDKAFPLVPAAASGPTEAVARWIASWLNPQYDPSNFRGLCNYELLITLAAFCALQEMVLKSLSVVHKYGFKPLINLLPFICLCASTLIVGSHWTSVLESNIRSCMALYGLLFVDCVTGLMLSHMTEAAVTTVRPMQIPAYVLATLGLTGNLPDGEDAKIAILLYLSAAATFTAFRFTVIISEITECLGIWCFDITTLRTTTVAFVSSKEAGKNGKKRR